MGIGAYPSPLRTFLDQLDELRSGGVPDMDTVGRPSPYSLILLGDDMLLFEPEEYDPQRGTWRALAPAIRAGRTADGAGPRPPG